MKWMTHQAVAVMAAAAFQMPLIGIAAAWGGSIAPDVVDQRRASFALFQQRKFNTTHRKASHWFGWWLVLGFFSLAGILGPLPDALLGGFAFGALTHVLLDMLTKKGVPLLPFLSTRLHIGLCRTGGLSEYLFLGACGLLFWALAWPDLHLLRLPLY